MLKLVDKKDCKKSFDKKKGCGITKCYDCNRFGKCLMQNGGTDLLPRQNIVRKGYRKFK